MRSSVSPKGTGDLDARDAHEPVVGRLLDGELARRELVVVGDGERVQSDLGGPLQQRVDGVPAVVGGRRVGV
jgi:hypothetical protein